MKSGEMYVRRCSGVVFMLFLIIVSTLGVLALKYVDFTYREIYSTVPRTCEDNHLSL